MKKRRYNANHGQRRSQVSPIPILVPKFTEDSELGQRLMILKLHKEVGSELATRYLKDFPDVKIDQVLIDELKKIKGILK